LNVSGTLSPTVSISPSATSVCSGTPVTFTATGTNGGTAPTYQWLRNGSPQTTGTTYSYTPSNGDVIAAIQTAGGTLPTCLSGTTATSTGITLNVSGNLTPSVSISPSATSVCSGTTVTFTASGSNGGSAPSYQWLRNGAPQTTGTTYSYTPSNGDVISAIQNAGGTLPTCLSSTTVTSTGITLNVSGNLSPSVSISPSATSVCSGTTVTFTASGSNGGSAPSYQWLRNGTPQSTGATYSYTPANGDVIRAIQNAGGTLPTCLSGTTATSTGITLNVSGNLTPSVSISPSATSVCSGTTVTFTASGTNGGSAPIYQWLRNGAPQSTGSTYSYTPSNGDVIAAIQYAGGTLPTCLSGTTATSTGITMNVSGNLTPSVSISSSATSVCSGTTVTFTATGTNGGAAPTYQWLRNGAPQTTGTTYSYTPSNGDVIRAIQTAGGTLPTCLSGTTATSTGITLNVSGNLTPSVSISSSATSVCSGTIVTFTATGTNGGSAPTYQWFRNGTAQTSGSTYSYTPANGDVIRAIQTAGGTLPTCLSGTTATSTGIALTVTPTVTPSVTISTPSTAVCAGSNVTFTATPVNGGSSQSYTWLVNGNIRLGSSATFTYTPVDGDLVVAILQSTGACLTSATSTSNGVSLTVNPSPVAASAVSGPNAVCANGISTYSITSIAVATGYSWTVPNGATITNGTNTNQITVQWGTTAGQIRAVPLFACGTGTGSSLSVSMITAPGAAGPITGNVSVCSSSTLNYSIAAVSGATNYTWTVPSGSTINSGQGTRSVSITFGSNSGNISVVPSNTCGTGTPSSASINVSGGAGTIGTAGAISGPTAVCNNSSGNVFSIATVSGATGYNWSVPSGASISAGNGTETVTISFGFVGGNVTVTPTNGCSNGTSATRSVGINSAPAGAGAITGPTSVCPGATGIQYTVNAVGGATGYTWTLPVGATVSAGNGSNSITVDFGGNGGTVTVVPVNGCGTGSGNNFTVGLTAALTPSVGITQTMGSNPSCAVDVVGFTATAVNGGATPTYQWYVNGSAVATATGASLVGSGYPDGSNISVTLSSSLACASPTTASSNVIQLGTIATGNSPCVAPSVPGISGLTSVTPNQTNVTYKVPVTGGATYVWTVPAGATITSGQGTNSITVNFGSTGGDVTLTVSNPYGSNTVSLPVSTGTVTDLSTEGQGITVEAYPNPFTDRFTLRVKAPGTGKVDVRVTDANGQTVHAANAMDAMSEVELGNELPSGIYIVAIRYNDKVSHIKLAKVK
ncbi:MAG: T9SS type A sorting domain-containing protein, partial [Cytophagales bacterium]|nr:T9SS type A sorting domain-containing protein [Cytophagales bacterium]